MKAYSAAFQLGIKEAIRHKADLISTLLVYATLMTVFSAIYNAFPVIELGHPGLMPAHLLWYFAVTEIVMVGTQGSVRELGRQIADGNITHLMQRPHSMMGLLQARVFGNVTINMMTIGFVAFMILPLATGLPCPIPLVLIPVFMLSVLLSALIFMTVGYTISTIEIHGPYSSPTSWIASKLIFTFGGLFFPVLFFPEALQHIIKFTPFPSVLAAPANFILLAQEPMRLLQGVIMQMVWLTIMIAIAKIAERRMLKIVLINGD